VESVLDNSTITPANMQLLQQLRAWRELQTVAPTFQHMQVRGVCKCTCVLANSSSSRSSKGVSDDSREQGRQLQAVAPTFQHMQVRIA
jgi:hypothetical protein